MAFPPERITVKRRRDEDPVDALFIQQKKQRPSGIWKLVDDENDRPQYAVPFPSPSAVKETRTTTTAFHAPTVPIVRTTLSSEDLVEQKNAIIPRVPEITKPTHDAFPITEKRHLTSAIAQPKHSSRQKTHNIVASASKARKFHLLNTPSSISSPFLNPKTLAQKHRKSRKKNLAVFVERIENNNRKANGTGDRSSRPVDSAGLLKTTDGVGVGKKEDTTSPLATPRKRPNATAAERKWRTETWATNRPEKPNEVDDGNGRRTAENIYEPSSQWDYGSAKLAEQLQEVALEEMRASEERQRGLSGGGGTLKVKPKPPKPRRQARAEKVVEEDGSGDDDDDDDDVMTDTVYLDDIDDDDDGDYVLDTYVRSSAAAASEPFGIIVTEAAESSEDHDSSLHNSSSIIDHSNVGILVIENEEEEALWEAFFAEDEEESDPEWNSEEEDENAEDYYGNDYPEDEVNSDDEFGRGAYGYRHAASDGEEFGWSGEEE